ncbi:MAG: DUF2169 domain-containing protein [Myxococcota bacterium]
MWAIENRTPYAADRTWVRDRDGAHHWIVVVKGTFDIGLDGKLTPVEEQPDPLHAPDYWGEPGLSSVRYEADLVAAKPATDVIVNGNAYAPKGKPARSVNVALRFAGLTKSLVVHGTRVYTSGIGGLGTSKAVPFTSKPITYEWAFGGSDNEDPDPTKQLIDMRNPVGKGAAKRIARLVNTPAHSVEYPNGNAAKAGPAGFGAIASYWRPRLELAGTYDAKWVENRKPLLPTDYDERFVLCAPADQRTPQHLRGGEEFALLNMTPEGLLTFALPTTGFRFTTYFASREETHDGKLVSVVVDAEEKRLMVTWQTSLPVKAPEADYLDITLIEETAS